jgi:hypothetical protein
MTTFCEEHQISRKTFYAIRARTRTDGAAAALEPRSRRPKTGPATLTDEVTQQALGVRVALDHRCPETSTVTEVLRHHIKSSVEHVCDPARWVRRSS